MTASAIYGFATKCGIGPANPVNSRVQFKDCQLKMREELKDLNGMRGTLSHFSNLMRKNIRRVGGMFDAEPTAKEMQIYLPWAMGTAAVTVGLVSTYALSNAALLNFVTVARDNTAFGGVDGKVFTYDHVGVDTMTLSGSKANALEMSLDLVGIDEAEANEGTFPGGLVIDIATKPFLFVDSNSGFTFNSALHPVDNLSVRLSNHIDRERYYNSPVLTGIFKTDRTIEVSFDLPWAGAETLYGAGTNGVPLSAVFTDPDDGSILELNFPSVVFARDTPTGRGRDEQHLKIMGVAGATADQNEMVAVLTLV